VLASPFWFPQFIWQGLILGPTGLPVRFADTFLAANEVVDRRFMRGMGFGLPLAVILMIPLSRARLSPRAWGLTAFFASALALQTRALRPLTEHLPLLSTSLFVWRLMLPAAVLGLGALWTGWRPAMGRERTLGLVALLSLLSMLVVLVGDAPANLTASAMPRTDQDWYRAGTSPNLVWGRREFLPNYGILPQTCNLPSGEVRTVSFAELQHGTTMQSSYLAVPAAPIGIVDYVVDGAAMAPTACGDSAIFGPLKHGAIATVSLHKVTILLWVRIIFLLSCGAVFPGCIRRQTN
jgi:hypothetical protein